MNASGKPEIEIKIQTSKIEKAREKLNKINNAKAKDEDELRSLQEKMEQAKTAMENGMREAADDE